MSDEICPCCSGSDSETAPLWVANGGFIILIYGMIVCLWGLGEICDRFFVPALKILCEELKVPDNVAGATFMAGGASSPELFVSFLGLFVSKSSIGIGTIIGSEIFNHMCISAGSVFWAKDGVLKLDPLILTREVLAYMSSLIFLIYVLEGPSMGTKTLFDKAAWQSTCLSISWQDSLVLILFYGVYAVIAANYNKVCKLICGVTPTDGELEEGLLSQHSEAESLADSVYRLVSKDSFQPPSLLAQVSVDSFTFTNSNSASTPASNSLNAISGTSQNDSTQLRSSFIHSTSSRLSESLNKSLNQSGKRDSYGVRMSNVSFKKSFHKNNPTIQESGEGEEEEEEDIHGHGCILDKPRGYTWITLYYLTLPLRYFFYFTTPDILKSHNRPRYGWTILSCMTWLALLAECLLVCLGYLGDLMHVSPAIMGLTFSAIGTSLPNIWSSMIVARDGGGDMAIAAALGANTFNIYLGLGIPYLCYTLAYSQDYNSLKDDGIVLLILVLLMILVLWYLVIILCGWEIRKWMGYVYVLVYFAVIAYCVVEL